MTLSNFEQRVTHYTLSTHPLNPSIIDITNKRTGELAYIKIRHKVVDMYAISLVDPKTFVAYAETHCESATSRSRSIVLHCGDEKNKEDSEVILKETAIIGFEWCFEWAGEKYRWIRQSRRSGELECRRKACGGDVCVAQYLPREIKNEYFGVIFLPGYNMAGLDDQERQGLDRILCISLLTILDKSDESSWFPIKRNNTVTSDTTIDGNTTAAPTTSTSAKYNGNNSSKKIEPIMELPLTPSNSKKEQKRNRIERELQLKLERDIRRSQKQILFEDNYNSLKRSATNSASSSKNNSPQVSPLPTPTTSTKTSTTTTTKTLSRQKSASLLRDRLTSSQLANMKHLDATATLQLPQAAANSTTAPSLASLFSSPPTTTMTAPTTTSMTNHSKKPTSSSSNASSNTTPLKKTTSNGNSTSNSATTSPVTTPTTYFPSNYYYYNAQSSSSASSGVAKSGSNSNVVQHRGATSVQWDHHSQQLQQVISSSKRPTAQRRVSTGDQTLLYYPFHIYPQHQIHPSAQQQHIHHHQHQQQPNRYDYHHYGYNMYNP